MGSLHQLQLAHSDQAPLAAAKRRLMGCRRVGIYAEWLMLSLKKLSKDQSQGPKKESTYWEDRTQQVCRYSMDTEGVMKTI